MMVFSKSYFRWCGAMSLLLSAMVALQMALLFWGPQAASLSQELALHGHPIHVLRTWLPFLGIPLALVAYSALALSRLKEHPGKAVVALLFLVIWAALELGMRGAEVLTVNHLWGPAFTSTTDLSAKASVLARAQTYVDLSLGTQVPIALCAFVIGTLLGFATWGGTTLQRLMSGFLFGYAGLALLLLASPFIPKAEALVNALYPFIRVPDRVLVGLWLWKEGAHE
jgi:hypothetical protein